jgi:hypothetical protein
VKTAMKRRNEEKIFPNNEKQLNLFELAVAVERSLVGVLVEKLVI